MTEPMTIRETKPGTLDIDVDATLEALRTQYQVRGDAIVPRASKDAPTVCQLGLIRDAHLNIQRILHAYKVASERVAALEGLRRGQELAHDEQMAAGTEMYQRLQAENDRLRQALEHYRRADDGVYQMLAGFRATPDMRDPNSVAGKALDCDNQPEEGP